MPGGTIIVAQCVVGGVSYHLRLNHHGFALQTTGDTGGVTNYTREESEKAFSAYRNAINKALDEQASNYLIKEGQ